MSARVCPAGDGYQRLSYVVSSASFSHPLRCVHVPDWLAINVFHDSSPLDAVILISKTWRNNFNFI